MTSEQCIDIIKNRLTALVNSGQLKAKIKPSKSSISFYVTDIDVGERPLLTLRLSNHNPAYQNYIRSDLTPPSEGYDTNISIEFYKPKYKASGRIARNRLRTKVEVPQDVKGVVPFFVNSYEYEPSILVAADIDQIYNAILSWINGGYNAEYIDPFANTPKEAKVKSKIANITWNIAQNISVDRNGNYDSANAWGADYVSENNRIKTNRNMNKKMIRLTESDLERIIEKSVKRIIREGAYDKYQNDLMDIELDSNQNINDLGFSSAYSQMNDPMIRNITGSTMRDMMSDRMGNNIDNDSESFDSIDGLNQKSITDRWLNTPNAARNFKEFPRQSRTNGGIKNYDNLALGSKKINQYKMRKR